VQFLHFQHGPIFGSSLSHTQSCRSSSLARELFFIVEILTAGAWVANGANVLSVRLACYRDRTSQGSSELAVLLMLARDLAHALDELAIAVSDASFRLELFYRLDSCARRQRATLQERSEGFWRRTLRHADGNRRRQIIA
jgi:hypothetical protein